jgi:hypothetical protein
MHEAGWRPSWKATDALWLVATQLREAVFASHTAAARHFGLVRTTMGGTKRIGPRRRGSSRRSATWRP